MTEKEWQECTSALPLLAFLRGKASNRQLRLTASAYCRSVWQFMGNASREAVLLGEEMADEPADESHRKSVVQAAIDAVCSFDEPVGDFFMAADMAYRVPCNDGWYAAEWTIGNWPELTCGVPIVRDIFGNPFRPVTLKPAYITPQVIALAQQIYDNRTFDQLPRFADALEEAGCDNTDMLAHCRGPGPHVRGCWAIDAVLGKE